MTDVLLVRHSQSVWNVESRIQGWADPPLSEQGEAAVIAGRRQWRPRPDLVVASDLQRARRTAELLVAGSGLPVHVDADLREYDVGQWSGLTVADLDRDWGGQWSRWHDGQLDQPPGGETRAAFATRIRRGLDAVHRRLPVGQALVVTHGGVIGRLARSLGAPRRPCPNLSGWRLTFDPDLRLVEPVSFAPSEQSGEPAA